MSRGSRGQPSAFALSFDEYSGLTVGIFGLPVDSAGVEPVE